VNRFRNSVDVKMLPREWWHRMIDVCGVGAFRRTELRDVFITHVHLDHLPLKEYVLGTRLRFFTASDYMPKIADIYGDSFEVFEYTDVARVTHTSRHGNRFMKVASIIFFIKNAVVIPECDSPGKFIEEYSLKYAFVFVSRQSHQHPIDSSIWKRKDVFIIDNATWRPYAPNVIPKIVFSYTDKELYRKFCAKSA